MRNGFWRHLPHPNSLSARTKLPTDAAALNIDMSCEDSRALQVRAQSDSPIPSTPVRTTRGTSNAGHHGITDTTGLDNS